MPQNRLFWPKTAPNPVITAKGRQTVPTLHVRHHCPVNKSPVLPSSSTICPKNGPKMAKNGLSVHYLCPTEPKPRTGRILGYLAQNQLPGAPTAPATPLLLWFPSLRIAQRDPYTLVPVVTWCTGVPGAKKKDFFQSCSYTTWDAQTSVFGTFCACGGVFWATENPKMPCKWVVLRPKMGQKWVKNAFFQK